MLEVTLPLARAQVHLSGSEAEERLNPPAEPPSWGNGVLGRISVVRAATQGLTPAELVEQSETSTLVRFFPIQVRPRTRHAMPEVLLALPPFMAGQTLEAPWRATSSSTRGDKPDAVEIEIVLPDA